MMNAMRNIALYDTLDLCGMAFVYHYPRGRSMCTTLQLQDNVLCLCDGGTHTCRDKLSHHAFVCGVRKKDSRF
jgi:hypothetical protein